MINPGKDSNGILGPHNVPAYYKDMAWMENVQVLDLTTGPPAINIDETS